ncbi:hypothetical protein CRG98_029250 [Punica granatum]|uniref:Uncharacterized protein n=1 Tax=Punica granatum TaxID=22663 RepID=A0A2I0J371_PUNGR|nr:hypothetical protein CRG98_029250 [Punica granatum]
MDGAGGRWSPSSFGRAELPPDAHGPNVDTPRDSLLPGKSPASYFVNVDGQVVARQYFPGSTRSHVCCLFRSKKYKFMNMIASNVRRVVPLAEVEELIFYEVLADYLHFHLVTCRASVYNDSSY